MSSNTMLRISGPPVSIAEHPLISTQPDDAIYKIFFLNAITGLLHTATTTEHAANPLTRGAALQRAAQFNQAALQTVRELLEHAPEEWKQFLDILEDRVIDILQGLIETLDIPVEPPNWSPDPQTPLPPPFGINDPEPPPTHSWQWIQTILQAQNVLEAIRIFAGSPNDLPGADTSVTDHASLSTINNVVASFQAHLDQLPLQPADHQHVDTDGSTFQKILDDAQQAIDDARAKLVEQAATHQQRSHTIVAPELHLHEDAIQGITATPLLPGTVRTAIVADNHPAGPASIVAYSINRELHIHSVNGDFHPDLDIQSRLFIIAAYMTHLSSDQSEWPTAPTESMRDAAYAIASLLGGYQQINPAGIHHIVSTATSRGIDPLRILQLFEAITGHRSQSIHKILANAEISPQWCTTSELESLVNAAINAGADNHILHAIVNQLNHQPQDCGLVPLTLPAAATHDIASAAADAGVNPRNIEQFIENANTGNSAYGFPHRFRSVTENTLLEQPFSRREIGLCECSTCDALTPHQYSYPDGAVIRIAGLAHAARTLSAECLNTFQDITDDHHRCTLAVYNCISTDRLAHFLLLNQTYPQHTNLQRITFIDQCYRKVKQQWNELRRGFSEATTQQVNNDPNTLAIIAELDLRYALHTVSYHSREYHSVYNDVMEQGFQIAAAANMVQIAALSVANLAERLPNHRLTPVITQHYDQTVALHDAMAASFNNTAPTDITPAARQHTSQIDDLQSVSIEPSLIGFYGIPDQSQTQAVDIICRYLHNGRIHIKMFDEPYAAGYPQLRAIGDMMKISSLAENPNTTNSRLETRSDNIIGAVSNSNHCVPHEAWEQIAVTARQHSLSNLAVNTAIADLRGYILRPDTDTPQARSSDDSYIHDSVFAEAQRLQFSPIQVNQLAIALGREDFTTELPKLPQRHINAILRAARRTRLEPHAIERINDAISA